MELQSESSSLAFAPCTNIVTQNWGWACEQIAAIDVVTAEGATRHCNELENKDLFWAARGAGPG